MYLYSNTTGGFYSDDVHTEDQIPADAVELSDEAYASLLAAQSAGKEIVSKGGEPVAQDAARPPREELLAIAAGTLRAAMNAAVKTRDYDSIETACSYATSTVEAWSTEALACSAWRDQVWQWFYSSIVADPRASLDGLGDRMPILKW